MGAEYHVSKQFSGAFAFTADGLRSLYERVGEATKSDVKVAARLANGDGIESKVLDDILNDSVLNTEVINQVSFRSRQLSDDYVTVLSVTISISAKSRSISMDIVGEPSLVNSQIHYLSQMMHGYETQRSIIYKATRFRYLILYSILLPALGFSALLNRYEKPTTVGDKINIFIWLSCLTFAILFALENLFSYVLPQVTFQIGKGVNVYASRATVAKWLFGILVTGVLGRIVYSLFTGQR